MKLVHRPKAVIDDCQHECVHRLIPSITSLRRSSSHNEDRLAPGRLPPMVNFETGIDLRGYQLFRGKDLYERQNPGELSNRGHDLEPLHPIADARCAGHKYAPGRQQPVHLGNCCIPVFEQMQDAQAKHGVKTLIRCIEIVKARLIERNICGPAGVCLALRDFNHPRGYVDGVNMLHAGSMEKRG